MANVWTLGYLVATTALGGPFLGGQAAHTANSQDRGIFGRDSSPWPGKAKAELVTSVERRAGEALKRGDYPLAEELCLQAIDLEPHSPFPRVFLARLYDRLGRDREAMETYGAVLRGFPNKSSTYEDDPRILARYGDLCVKFGREGDATAAYTKALAHGEVGFGAYSPRPLPRNGSARALRAAAHLVAGLCWRGKGDFDKCLAEINASVQADPGWWLAHYYRGYETWRKGGMKDQSREAFAEAARLATGADRELVIERAKAKGLLAPHLNTPRTKG